VADPASSRHVYPVRLSDLNKGGLTPKKKFLKRKKTEEKVSSATAHLHLKSSFYH
jgi:hypothetical protein